MEARIFGYYLCALLIAVASLRGAESSEVLERERRGLLDGVLGLVENLLGFIPREPTDVDARPYEAPFCYDSKKKCGQKKWKGLCRIGKRQSPINFKTNEATVVRSGQNPLEFGSKYDKQHKSFYVGNNGHSVVIQVAPKGRSEAELHIRDLNMTFFFSHIHFHWNAADGQKGSEHRIDGIGYDMEMHLVHYRDSFPNVETALKSNTSNLAAVVGVFVNIGPHNDALDQAIQAIRIHALHDTKGYKKVNRTLVVGDILPSTTSFFRTQGSLTVPKCVENILWLMLEEPITISREQMKVFHNVECHDCPRHKMKNYRHIQPRNGRKVEYFNFGLKKEYHHSHDKEEPIYSDE